MNLRYKGEQKLCQGTVNKYK